MTEEIKENDISTITPETKINEELLDKLIIKNKIDNNELKF